MNKREHMQKVEPVLDALRREVRLQQNTWGVQSHPDGTSTNALSVEFAKRAQDMTKEAFANGYGAWRHILDEEVAEAFAEEDAERLEEELTQVAAVCISWIVDLRNRNGL